MGPLEQLDFLPSPVATLFKRKSQWPVPNPHCQRLLKAANTKASAAGAKGKQKPKAKAKGKGKAKAKAEGEKKEKKRYKARQPTEYGATRAAFMEELLGQIVQLVRAFVCFGSVHLIYLLSVWSEAGSNHLDEPKRKRKALGQLGGEGSPDSGNAEE